MKFKDLQVGDLFTMPRFEPGVVEKKIEPEYNGVTKNKHWRHIEVAYGIRGDFVMDDDEVILVAKEATM